MQTVPVRPGAVETPLRRELPRSRRLAVRAALATADLAGLAGAFAATHLAGAAPWAVAEEVAAFVLLAPVWLVAAKLAGLYGGDELRIDHSTVSEVATVSLLATLAAWALFLLAHATGQVPAADGRLAGFWAVAIVGVAGCRAATRAVLGRVPSLRRRALILGDDDSARLVARKLRRHPEYGVDVVGFVAEADDALGTPAELPELVRRLGIDRVVVSLGSQTPEETLDTVRTLHRLSVFVDVVPRLHEIVAPSGRIHAIEDLSLIDLPPVPFARSTLLLKRALDLAGAVAGLLLAAPFLLVFAVLIRLESPGPALFRQTRLGAQMREFTAFKFRTMRQDTGEDAHREFIAALMSAGAAPEANGLYKLDRPETTRVGAFLRRTSLDELPQLLNVLRGEMSLVGPRPCIPYETQFFQPHHFERFLVPAGVTGLWQVTARGHATFAEALDMDVAYVRGWSLALDLTLLLRTVPAVLARKGTA